MLATKPYIRIPEITLPDGRRITDRATIVARLGAIREDRTAIALRRSKPFWIPHGGEMSYDCWRDYYISNRVSMPYPGGLLAQPGWFKHDLGGFNDMEAWCYLKHEQVTLMDAIRLAVPEEDTIWRDR